MNLLRLFPILLCLPLFGASSRIQITLTVTNNPAEDETLVVNTDTRTWKDTVADSATQVATGDDIGAASTNLYNHLAATPFSGPMVLSRSSTNVITLLGTVGQSMSATATGWATVAYSTQTVSTLQPVRLPMSSLSELERTNSATMLVTAIDDYAQSPFDPTSTAASSLVNVSNAQTIVGAKIFEDITTTNLANYGNAVSSPGSGTNSEQFGTGADASGLRSLAVGKDSTASNTETIAIGYGADATAVGSVAIGSGTTSSGTSSISIGGEITGDYSIGIGSATEAAGDNAIAIGDASSANYDGSVAIGKGAATTAAGQIKLGGTTNTVSIPGLTTGTFTNSTYHGTIGTVTSGYWSSGAAAGLSSTNTTMRGTNIVYGNIRLPRTDYTSLANGDNSGVDFGSATYVKIDDGPTAAFTIAGIAGGADGRVLILDNRVAYNMTVGHEDGAEATAANRIVSPTGSDLTSTTYAVVWLIYDAEDSRWHVINWQD